MHYLHFTTSTTMHFPPYYRIALLVTILISSLLVSCNKDQAATADPVAAPATKTTPYIDITEGLVVDLNADRLVLANDRNEVLTWSNSVTDAPLKNFIPNDTGIRSRKPGSGRPHYRTGIEDLNSHSAIIFKEDELINRQEDALDDLLTGSGYTWVTVLKPYPTRDSEQQTEFGQDRLRDVNSFMGNLRNGGNYEGLWGNFEDDLTVWCGSRSGMTFGRFDENNPKIAGPKLTANQFHVVAARMGAGTGTVPIDLFVNNSSVAATGQYPVNTAANPSRLAIGTERNATNHPGTESFDGEIARILIYERPLSDEEMNKIIRHLRLEYIKR